MVKYMNISHYCYNTACHRTNMCTTLYSCDIYKMLFLV